MPSPDSEMPNDSADRYGTRGPRGLHGGGGPGDPHATRLREDLADFADRRLSLRELHHRILAHAAAHPLPTAEWRRLLAALDVPFAAYVAGYCDERALRAFAAALVAAPRRG